MATSQMNEMIQWIRRAVLDGSEADLTDGQLLESFIRNREEAAIAALVRRHGPMVWAVCHRVLRNHHDAEDAFQATFLVLLRKAASIVSREKLANWLYGVAHQTSLNAKETAARRKGRERQVIDMPEPKVAEPDLWLHLQPFLDQDLSRLPDKYRITIVLCDLERKTRKEAARQLMIPEGTLSSRLTTARTMLAKRLARHGLAVAGGSVAALFHEAASASVPTSVVCSTIKAVTQVAAGKVIATAKVAALAEGVVKSMLLTKIKTVTALLLMLGMVTLTSAMLLAWGKTGDNGNNVEKPAKKDDKQAAQVQQNDRKKDPPKYFTNSIGMKFVWIPPGTFIMGSPEAEEGRKVDEIQHRVTLSKGFYMGVYTVTQEEWQAVMGNNPSKFRGEKNLPVHSVSWDVCQEFIKKLREKDQKPYRLPTEAEWEYACRAGTTTPFHFGETISTDQANYNGQLAPYGKGKKGVYREKATPVGSFPANAFGLFDMHGNVWQWCQDSYSAYPQTDVVNPQGPKKGGRPVFRGGSWDNYPLNCRSARRVSGGPGVITDYLGFRLCFFLD